MRLRALAGLVPSGARVADIGSGHALLPRLLLAGGGVEFCIATELVQGRLDTARSEPKHQLGGRIEYRFGSGLSVLRPSDRIDTVVLAGMGTRTILSILEDQQIRELGIRLLVLQPQTDPALLRRELAERRYAIVAEQLVHEGGRYYPVIAAGTDPGSVSPTHPTLSESDLFVAGPCLVRSGDPLVRRLWLERLAYYKALLENRPQGAGREQALGQRDLARRILSALCYN